ncbi:MAG: hypothetical protein KUG72_12250 [Pseudomonadales bacterium]|nr:hypothetical protein [Pseudomonadales bacterium]
MTARIFVTVITTPQSGSLMVGNKSYRSRLALNPLYWRHALFLFSFARILFLLVLIERSHHPTASKSASENRVTDSIQFLLSIPSHFNKGGSWSSIVPRLSLLITLPAQSTSSK